MLLTTDEFRNVSVTCRKWAWVAGVVDTCLVIESRPELETVNK